VRTLLSSRVLLELEEWARRRARLYCWKQWKRPGTRRRHLMALGISKERVKLASRADKRVVERTRGSRHESQMGGTSLS